MGDHGLEPTSRPSLLMLNVVGGGAVGGNEEHLSRSKVIGDSRHRHLEPQGFIADRKFEELLFGR